MSDRLNREVWLKRKQEALRLLGYDFTIAGLQWAEDFNVVRRRPIEDWFCLPVPGGGEVVADPVEASHAIQRRTPCISFKIL